MTVDPSAFRRALGNFPTGVTVVTARDGSGAPVGITISSFCSLSLAPPLVLFCLDRAATCFEALSAAPGFAVNVLSEQQEALSRRFAQRITDKWDQMAFETWKTGAPILEGCAANIECRTEARHAGGDHVILVGRPLRVETHRLRPLVYHRGSYHKLGQPA